MQLNSSPFSLVKKRVFSFAKYPQSPYSMLGYNRTIITCTNINFLLNMGQGWRGVGGGGRKEKKRLKVAAFPTVLMMIVVCVLMKYLYPNILLQKS